MHFFNAIEIYFTLIDCKHNTSSVSEQKDDPSRDRENDREKSTDLRQTRKQTDTQTDRLTE